MKVIKIPFAVGSTGKSKNAGEAPDKIIEKARKLTATEKGNHFYFEETDIEIDDKNIEESLNRITEEIPELPFIALGGDHTITYAIIRKIANKNTGIIIFDAHPDLMQRFTVPTHENYLRHLIEENIINSQQIVLIGIRNIDKEEKRFLYDNKINYFSMNEIIQEGIHQITDNIMESMNKFEKVYISIDIDVIDPAFSPGVNYPETGGLSSREFLYMLNRLMNLKNYAGGDLVEVVPENDKDDMTLKIAGKILAEMTGK